MSETTPRSPFRGLRPLVLVHPGEGRPLGLSVLYFFLLLCSFYLLRPLRESLGIAKGAERLPWLMTGTLLVMLAANPVFATLVSKLPRRRFIPATYRFFGASFLAFFLAFRWAPGQALALGYGFYVWLSVFNLFVVAVFWGYMADLWTRDQVERLFGLLALGGTLGAMAGASFTEVLVGSGRLPPVGLLLLSALVLEGATQCARQLADHFALGDRAGGAREPGPGPGEGLRLVFRSPLLGLLCLYMLLFTVTSTFLYLKQGEIVAATFKGMAGRTAAFARIDRLTNLLAMTTQLFLTSRLIRMAGLRVVLLILPLVTLAGFGALLASPTFGILLGVMVVRRGFHYAVDRPARELLYIPLSADAKYKAKAFVDTFVFRAGDFLGVWAPTALGALGVAVAPVAFGLSTGWLVAGWGLGRVQARKG